MNQLVIARAEEAITKGEALLRYLRRKNPDEEFDLSQRPMLRTVLHKYLGEQRMSITARELMGVIERYLDMVRDTRAKYVMQAQDN